MVAFRTKFNPRVGGLDVGYGLVSVSVKLALELGHTGDLVRLPRSSHRFLALPMTPVRSGC